jgi:DNA-directed RNA polymerase subunit K/omega
MKFHQALAAAVLLLSAVAPGQDKGEKAEVKTVDVQAELVLASTQGDKIDPPALKAMQEKLAGKIRYTSLTRLELTKVAVTRAPPSTLKLPNAKVVTFTLNEVKEGIAKITVELPPAKTQLTLGREGSVYHPAGKHQGGDLWLVLSAAGK